MNKSESKNLSDKIYDKLKQEIFALKLVPGQAILENEICDRFSVSRTPVRDAMWRLQEQGFVDSIPYRGTYVTKLNYDNIKQMIYMRIAVETAIIHDFIDIATPMILEEVHHIIRKQEAIIFEKNFKPEQFYRLDAQMHSIWFDITGKNKIWNVLQGSQLHYTRYRMLDFGTEVDFTRIIKEHQELFGLIQRKDKEGLTAALKAHLSYSIKRMKHQVNVEYRDYFDDIGEEEE